MNRSKKRNLGILGVLLLGAVLPIHGSLGNGAAPDTLSGEFVVIDAWRHVFGADPYSPPTREHLYLHAVVEDGGKIVYLPFVGEGVVETPLYSTETGMLRAVRFYVRHRHDQVLAFELAASYGWLVGEMRDTDYLADRGLDVSVGIYGQPDAVVFSGEPIHLAGARHAHEDNEHNWVKGIDWFDIDRIQDPDSGWEPDPGPEPERSVRLDFDGDGKSDLGYYHPPTGMWHLSQSTDGEWQTQFGYAGTIPVVGDYDGDGRADVGVYYPPGGNWYIFGTERGFFTEQFGYAGTLPLGAPAIGP